jgi:hypothetical protein
LDRRASSEISRCDVMLIQSLPALPPQDGQSAPHGRGPLAVPLLQRTDRGHPICAHRFKGKGII